MVGVRSEAELQRVMEETRDRYGAPPASIENLAEYAFIRLLADRIGIESIHREGQLVVLKCRPEARLDPTWLFKIVQERKDVQLTPPATLKLDMRLAGGGAAESPHPAGGGAAAEIPPAVVVDGACDGRRGHRGLLEGRDPPARQGRSPGRGGRVQPG